MLVLWQAIMVVVYKCQCVRVFAFFSDLIRISFESVDA